MGMGLFSVGRVLKEGWHHVKNAKGKLSPASKCASTYSTEMKEMRLRRKEEKKRGPFSISRMFLLFRSI